MDTETQITSKIMEMPKGDRYYFHSSPRTASTVLLRVLNLPEQPDLNYAPQDGYFFISHFMKQRKLGVQYVSEVPKSSHLFAAKRVF